MRLNVFQRALVNNAVNNPDIIRNIPVKDLKPDTIKDLIAEVYTLKSKSIIPEIMDFEFDQTKGKEIDSKDLADTFPGLWQKYIFIMED